jgi:hypothetical protein
MPLDRRAFVAQSVALALAALRGRLAAAAVPAPHHCGAAVQPRQEHPDPRPGIDASHVVAREQLGHDADTIQAFDVARQIPQVLDGIRCHCGCADQPNRRSLLSCFEGDAMARDCHICQSQARLAFDLHKSGRTLGVIRSVIDRRF